mgnify:CR=1 FL=1
MWENITNTYNLLTMWFRRFFFSSNFLISQICLNLLDTLAHCSRSFPCRYSKVCRIISFGSGKSSSPNMHPIFTWPFCPHFWQTFFGHHFVVCPTFFWKSWQVKQTLSPSIFNACLKSKSWSWKTSTKLKQKNRTGAYFERTRSCLNDIIEYSCCHKFADLCSRVIWVLEFSSFRYKIACFYHQFEYAWRHRAYIE